MKKNNPHNLPETCIVLEELKNEHATVYAYKNFAVVEVNEGVVFSLKTGLTFLLKALKIFGTKPWFIISNRRKSYSVKPTDYKYLERIPSLKAIAVVSQQENAKSNAFLEAQFFKKPFETFEDINSAYLWATNILTENQSIQGV